MDSSLKTTDSLSEEIHVDAHQIDASHQSPSVMSPDISLMVLTWITFFSLLAILYKFAWKPILEALEKREQTIRQSLDDADAAQKKLAELNASTEKIISEARQQSQGIIEESRKSAMELSKVIQKKAKEEADILLTNVRKELSADVETARHALRKESVEIAVHLATKIIQENMDSSKNRKIIEEQLKIF